MGDIGAGLPLPFQVVGKFHAVLEVDQVIFQFLRGIGHGAAEDQGMQEGGLAGTGTAGDEGSGLAGAFHIQPEVLHLVAASAHGNLQLVVIGRPVIGLMQQGIQLNRPGHVPGGIRQLLPEGTLGKARSGNIRFECPSLCGKGALPLIGDHHRAEALRIQGRHRLPEPGQLRVRPVYQYRKNAAASAAFQQVFHLFADGTLLKGVGVVVNQHQHKGLGGVGTVGVVIVNIGIFSAVEPDPFLHQAADPVNSGGNGILRGLGAVKGDGFPHRIGQLGHQGADDAGKIPLHTANVQSLHREGYQKLQKPADQHALKVPAFDLGAGGIHDQRGKRRGKLQIKGVGGKGLRIRVEPAAPEFLCFRRKGKGRPAQQKPLRLTVRPQPVTGQKLLPHLFRLPVQPLAQPGTGVELLPPAYVAACRQSLVDPLAGFLKLTAQLPLDFPGRIIPVQQLIQLVKQRLCIAVGCCQPLKNSLILGGRLHTQGFCRRLKGLGMHRKRIQALIPLPGQGLCGGNHVGQHRAVRRIFFLNPVDFPDDCLHGPQIRFQLMPGILIQRLAALLICFPVGGMRLAGGLLRPGAPVGKRSGKLCQPLLILSVILVHL